MSNYYEAAAVRPLKAALIYIIVRKSLRDYFLVHENFVRESFAREILT